MIQQVLAQYHVLLFPTIHTGEGHLVFSRGLYVCSCSLLLLKHNDFLYSEAIYKSIQTPTIVNALCDLQESPSVKIHDGFIYESSLNKFPSSTTSERDCQFVIVILLVFLAN